ncbi:MAG: hypothetical protein A2015_17590 [Spirochaetes bacterium GWF1_31_7]|nr:MAG: hypothetical protein A2Y30_05580 [Spirochaetes bacterium GWE1_32_154]OHD47282.1 MAG: hypothetical protein A2015_17590 [Spirochaetes bacterium GWF1_31_7]OHD49460.1 MAG: hypothetical protein A2Y29_01640 [Spirochaetes bacterium GWE2_31_10]HBD96540.1 hypothetical protein [Spirochaetia bacterium]HBI38888.1 hypothetical protein [Spirochaetia bacterium]
MRLLIFSDEFPPLGNRRAYTVYYFLKDFANRFDFEIDVITASRNKNKKEMFADNIFIHYIDVGRRGEDASLNWYEKIIYSTKAMQYYKKNFKKKEYDLIHFFSLFSGYMLNKYFKRKFIVNVFPTDIYGKAITLRKYFVKNVLSKSLASITSCQADWNEINKIIPKKPAQLIYSGVIAKKFIFNLRPVNKKLTLLSVGRMVNKSDYEFLISALKGISDYRLIIIGDGKYRQILEKMSIKEAVDVEFTGRLGHDEIKKIMSRSDIYISVTSVGGISNSMMEAMSMGLPVICYDTGGNKEIMTENGFVIEKNNINGLRSSFDIYRNNKSLIKRHGKNSRKIAQGLSWKISGEKYRDLYKSLLTNSQ